MTLKLSMRRLLVMLLLLPATRVVATTFIVPTDEQMVARSQRIVIGTVQSAYVRERDGSVDTVYDFRVERVLKGATPANGSLEVISPGGALEHRGVIVQSAATFAVGERVLLFLTEQHGEWTPLDLTLGTFRFVTSGKGERLLTRDVQDIAAWERDGSPHEEKVRREEAFLSFVEERAKGRDVKSNDLDYLVDPATVILPPEPQSGAPRIRSNTVYSPGSYTSNVSCAPPFCSPTIGPYPTRWPSFATAVTFQKKNDQNISGAVDGGVSTIQNALASWTNDCGSNVNLAYGGTTTTASADFDDVHVVEFNDPQGRVGGTFASTGTIAITFTSYNDTHTTLSETWWSISDADIVFNDGFTATDPAFHTAMTHEVGHAIGWRHSNARPLSGNDKTVTCNAGTEECTPTGTAIMFWNAGTTSAFEFTLQPWDVNAVRAVYPSTCVTVLAPTNVVAAATGATSVSVSWTPATSATGYKVYRSADKVTFGFIGSSPSSPFTDNLASANTAYLYKVTSTDSTSESGFSNADFATTVVFTDPTLVAGTTPVKAAHVTELRTAVNALRTLNGGQAAFAFTDPTLNSTVTIKAVHISELQTQLNAVRTALGFPTISFTETPVAGTTLVKKIHIDELRAGVQ